MTWQPEVLCDPELPGDWDERERRLQRERLTEIAVRDRQLLEPDVLDMFRFAGAV